MKQTQAAQARYKSTPPAVRPGETDPSSSAKAEDQSNNKDDEIDQLNIEIDLLLADITQLEKKLSTT